MAVYKEEKTNTWRAVYRYTDWNGERKQTQKRASRPNGRHKPGSANSSTRPALIWT